MRVSWRALPAMFVTVVALVAAPAQAADWHCTYYRWNAAEHRWDLVAWLQPQSRAHELPPWDCDYCYVPFRPAPDGGGSGLDQVLAPAWDAVAYVDRAVDETTDEHVPEHSAAPLDGPECPDVAPVWDTEADDLPPLFD